MQQAAFEAPQHPEEPPNSPASAKLAMLIATSTAPVILIHRIEERLLPLGISNLGSSIPAERRCRSVVEFQAADPRRLRRASQFKRLGHHLVPVVTTAERTSSTKTTSADATSAPHSHEVVTTLTSGASQRLFLVGLAHLIGLAGAMP